MPPNILFITDDQHRWDYLEMTGRFAVRTPHLADMAREGVWYPHTYSPCPLCMPARASLHNGLYAHQTGLNTNIGHWPFGIPMLPALLRQCGYRTAAIGKLHVFEGVHEHLDLCTVAATVRRELGYDELYEVSGKALAWHLDCEWTHAMHAHGKLETYRRNEYRQDNHPFPLEEADYQDIMIADQAVNWLDNVATDRPFFLWAGLVSPHPPFDAPQRYLDRYGLAEHPAPVDPTKPDAYWRVRRQHYSAMVELVDEQVGRLLAALERRGLRDETLVIFAADHGEMLDDHGLAGKCYPHDPSVRVPLLLRWPGHVPTGVRSDALVELIDLPATCLHAATGDPGAVRLLPGSAGRSLLAPGDASQRPHVYSEDGGQFNPAFQMLRDHDWKYVLYPHTGEERLHHLPTDPDERHNLAADPQHAATKDHYKTRLLTHLATTPAPNRIHPSPSYASS